MQIVGGCLLVGALAAGTLYLMFLPARACPDRPAAECYFPVAIAAPEGTQRGDLRHWYAEHLSAMNEPSLLDHVDGTVARFLWLRADHHPVAVRVVASNGRHRLVAVELDGAGGHAPGRPLRRIDRDLASAEVAVFQAAVASADVSSVPARVARNGRDGAQWVFEFHDGTRYRLVERWSPEQDPMRELGLVFLQLTGWDVPARDVY